MSTGIVYTTLADRLRASIRNGEFRPGELLGSEHELARRESLSRMTVRRASGLLVSEGLLERRPGKGLYVRRPLALDATSGPTSGREVAGHSAVPTVKATALAGSSSASSQPVQVVAGNLTWEPCLQVSRGVQAAAKDRGVAVQLYDAHGDADLDLSVVRNLPDSASAGAVIVALHGDAFAEAVYSLKARNYPFVLVDQRLFDIKVPSVTADNHAGGVLAAEHLLRFGHRRLAFVGDLVASTVRDRLAGYRDAINDAGLAFDRSLVVDIDVGGDRLGDWSAKVEASIRDLMARPNPPTALFCSCDAIARSAYRALTSLSIPVPGEVSVLGFDDDPLAEWLTPGLTSIRQPFQEMGRAAMDMLFARIGGVTTSPGGAIARMSAPLHEHLALPVSLVPRGSVGPAPASVTS